MLTYEKQAREEGAAIIAGIDEAGRGPLAGPVVASAVVLPEGVEIDGLTDSKQLTARKREELFEVIHANALCVGVGFAPPRTIDSINILRATLMAMLMATNGLVTKPDYLLIDGLNTIDWPGPQRAIVKGDCLSLSISAIIAAREEGAAIIAGIDEAGRGPLAGPVVASAVVLPEGVEIDGLTDSKQLTARKREELFEVIHANALCVGVGFAPPRTIDSINILRATLMAMLMATNGLVTKPDYLLIDGLNTIDWPGPQRAIVKGDCLSLSISAASVIAKVTRDAIMVKNSAIYPRYGFERNKGYGSASHRAAIARHGPCPIHRMTFRGVREFVNVGVTSSAKSGAGRHSAERPSAGYQLNLLK